MSNGETADPTTSAVVSIATTSGSGSLKGEGQSVGAGVTSEEAVDCDEDETAKDASHVSGTLPSTSATQSASPDFNLSYHQSECSSGNRSVSSSSGKRKAALPRKRPAILEEPVKISADTGEVMEEDCLTARLRVLNATKESTPQRPAPRLKRVRAMGRRSGSNRLYKRPSSAFAGTLVDSPSDERNVPADCASVASNAHDRPRSVSWLCGGSVEDNSVPVSTQDDALNLRCETRSKTTPDTGSVTADHPPAVSAADTPATASQLLDRTMLRGDATLKKNKVVPAHDSASAVLNGLCAPGVTTIQDLLSTPSPTTINAAINSLLFGVGDVSGVGSLSPAELLTATSGALPFLSTSLADLSADPQKVQMALLEAATAAANNTICGLFGGAHSTMGELDKSGSGVPKTQSLDSVVASTSREQLPPSLLIPAMIRNGKADCNPEGLCIGIPLPAVLPELNGTLNLAGVKDSQSTDGNLAFAQRLLAAEEGGLSGDTPKMTREDRIDLEELENFAQTFKKQRIKFGFTQGDVGMALGRRYGTDFSQTTISRFEALNLSFKNMCKLRPLLKEWLADAELAIAGGATVNDLLDAHKADTPAVQLCQSAGQSSSVPVIAVDECPSPSVGSSGVPMRKRRKRTNLDSAQRAALDGYFQMNPRPDHDCMAQIATSLELDRDVVRVWFCNRRQKLRRA